MSKGPLLLKLKNAGRLLLAMARMHNFCIDLGEAFGTAEARENTNTAGASSTQVANHLSYLPSDPIEADAIGVPGVSDLRERIVDFIQSASLSMPHRNIVRRNTVQEQ
jgi:hypothetical protein